MMQGRDCAYCPEPGADACVRVTAPEAGSVHVFAHRKCARDRGVSWWYVITDADEPQSEAAR
ncbi:hypothetical protein ACFQ9J_30795 [Streptomyces sp. NPDC056529]|uniref:hypothetical protein n=1 Tax=Streptomyces sp. NPDC056529 TaxID=3345855 RepID=UPI0036CC9900